MRGLGLAFAHQHDVEASIDANLGLLRNAPVRFQHDDYHVGNLIVLDGHFAGIVDFNRFDWGDPIEDFFKVPKFSVPVSSTFARGQVLGYCSGDPGGEFWRRYNLYVAMNLHAQLLGAVYIYEEGLSHWQEKIRGIVETHDFRGGGRPAWF